MHAIKCDNCGAYVDGVATAFRRLAMLPADPAAAVTIDLCGNCVRNATGFERDRVWDDHEALLAIVRRAEKPQSRKA